MYNPSDVGKKGTIFGLPYSHQESDLIFLPVNLDVTVSYKEGTSLAPGFILDESSQLDLSIPTVINPWELKMAMMESLVKKEENAKFRSKAKTVIEQLESIGSASDEALLYEINTFCEEVHAQVESKCDEILNQGKKVCVIGGDHSSPLGLIRSLAKREEFGILQIDAHMDLRNSYEGFNYSHASIMHNGISVGGVSSLTQVSIRDYCKEEENVVAESEKIHVFFDEMMYKDKLNGKTWANQTTDIIKTLPAKVYISFDIDGLDPSLCPNTGTPVPGGLTFNQATFLIDEVAKSGREIIGFDLCEVGTTAWDANVGARILYRLAIALGISQELLHWK